MKLTLLEHPTPLTARDFQARLETRLQELKGELDADVRFVGLSPTGWAQIKITGEDSEIMSELIANRFALAHTELREVETNGNYEAEIIGSDGRGITFDIGTDTRASDFVIPTAHLTAQLADGKDMPLRQVIECYCLYPGMRVGVRVDAKSGHQLEGWLSDGFADTIADWVATGLDRIQVLECFKREAESAVQRAHLTRDVLVVDSVTLTVQSVVCKLGTDAVGLIPKLGHILRKQQLKPFQPKKITRHCRPW
jgi:hypothetical protein